MFLFQQSNDFIVLGTRKFTHPAGFPRPLPLVLDDGSQKEKKETGPGEKKKEHVPGMIQTEVWMVGSSSN